ncbi:putative iron reductase domain protein [Hypomontagnella submonticulosa]|nr:putative iron reductase domain protein [Hypomontagnella submonticulosa]
MRAHNIVSQLALASSAALSFLVASSLAQDAGNTQQNTTAGSVFITPARDLAFALNVPNDSTTDLFFSMMMPSGVSWGAIGLGSDVMEGSLIFLIYPSASGQGVTMSPRLSTGHTEPVYTPDIKVEALDGTGFFNDTYIFNGRCSNCRTWNGGSRKVNVASKADNMLYATGESGNYLKSDALDGPLKWHYNYGTFTMDMVLATGPGGVPVIDRSQNSKLIGTVQHESEQGSMDAKLIVHAVIMVFVFLGLYPFGIFVLRLGGWVRWHGWNQGAALILTIMGSGLGFAVSSSYNRTKSYNTAHQVIGILIFIFIIAQFALGYFHHRTFKKTQQTTKMAPIHVWLGRLMLVLGVINAFLGFPLALSPNYDWAIGGLALFIFPAMAFILLTKNLISKRWNKSKDEPKGYNMEPWQQPNAQAGYGGSATYTQGPHGQNVSIPAMNSYAPYQAQRTADLGQQQSSREYV